MSHEGILSARTVWQLGGSRWRTRRAGTAGAEPKNPEARCERTPRTVRTGPMSGCRERLPLDRTNSRWCHEDRPSGDGCHEKLAGPRRYDRRSARSVSGAALPGVYAAGTPPDPATPAALGGSVRPSVGSDLELDRPGSARTGRICFSITSAGGPDGWRRRRIPRVVEVGGHPDVDVALRQTCIDSESIAAEHGDPARQRRKGVDDRPTVILGRELVSSSRTICLTMWRTYRWGPVHRGLPTSGRRGGVGTAVRMTAETPTPLVAEGQVQCR